MAAGVDWFGSGGRCNFLIVNDLVIVADFWNDNNVQIKAFTFVRTKTTSGNYSKSYSLTDRIDCYITMKKGPATNRLSVNE